MIPAVMARSNRGFGPVLRYREDISRLVFAKQDVRCIRQFQPCADAACQRHFRHRDQQAAVRNVMADVNRAAFDLHSEEVAIAALGRQVDRGRRSVLAAGDLP